MLPVSVFGVLSLLVLIAFLFGKKKGNFPNVWFLVYFFGFLVGWLWFVFCFLGFFCVYVVFYLLDNVAYILFRIIMLSFGSTA